MLQKLLKKTKSIPETVKISVAYTMCSIVQKSLAFFTMPLFTSLLTQEQYGQYNVYISWSSIISIFITLNLAYGTFSTAMVKFREQRDEYISSVQGICLSLSALFLMLYLPLSGFFNQFFEMPTYIIVIMVAEIIAQTSILLWSGKKRFEYKYKSVVIVTLINSVSGILVALLLVTHSEEKGYARIIGFALVSILIGGFFFIWNMIKGKSFFNRKFWKYALSFNIPLLIYYLSQSVFNQSDRIIISMYCGIDKAAMYGVAYNFAIMLTFVLEAICNSYVPWLYDKLSVDRQKENRPVSAGISVLLSLMLLCVIWFAPELIRVMAGESYLPALPVVAPVAMSPLLLFYSRLSISVMFYYEKKAVLIISSIWSALLNIILNILLLPYYGFVVAGYTTLFSFLLFVIANYIGMRFTLKKEGVEFELFKAKDLILVFIGFVLSAYLGVALYGSLPIRIAVTLVVLLILFIFRKPFIKRLSVLRKPKGSGTVSTAAEEKGQ